MYHITLICLLPIFASEVESVRFTVAGCIDSQIVDSNFQVRFLDKTQDDQESAKQETEEPVVQLNLPETWPRHNPKDSRMEFRMPANPRLSERTFTPVEGQATIRVRNYIGSYDNGTIVLVANFHDLPVVTEDPKFIEDTLEGAIQGSIANLNGKLVESRPIRYAKNPGREYKFRFAANEQVYLGIGRVFLVGQRQHLICAMMLEEKFDEVVSEGFLKSLRLNEPEPETEQESQVQSDQAKTESDG